MSTGESTSPVPEAGSDPVAFIEQLFSLPVASQPFGEPVSISSHMRQTATLAESDGADAALVVAALLHDVAFVVSSEETGEATIEADHARIGAAWLARWFPASVCEPVRLHVEAKRYLTFVEPSYLKTLSDESVRTLGLQGGVMTAAEAMRFEAGPHARAAERLRRWDDSAKKPVAPPPIGHFSAALRAAWEGGRRPE